MAHTFLSHGAVALVHWEEPEPTDVREIVAKLRAMGKGPRGVFLIHRIPEASPAPSPDATREIVVRFGRLDGGLCGSTQMVFEGSGFAVGVKRSVLTGILLAANHVGAHEGRADLRIHASLREMFDGAPIEKHADIRAVLRALNEREQRQIVENEREMRMAMRFDGASAR